MWLFPRDILTYAHNYAYNCTNYYTLSYSLSQAKERQRKSSDEASLDEEFLMKTYNPSKQDKFTHFTPNALEAIEEESESLDQSSMASFSL